ncbi:MAG: hypothetical protein JWP66_232 [Naasia sp.]|nr:hypothetical protein [Naasia sp.]
MDSRRIAHRIGDDFGVIRPLTEARGQAIVIGLRGHGDCARPAGLDNRRAAPFLADPVAVPETANPGAAG